jgi:hypothetical protein
MERPLEYANRTFDRASLPQAVGSWHRNFLECGDYVTFIGLSRRGAELAEMNRVRRKSGRIAALQKYVEAWTGSLENWPLQ